MEQLLNQAKEAGLTEEKGKDALGGLLALLKSKLNDPEYAKVKEAIPGTDDLVNQAEQAAANQGGLPECLTGLLAQLKDLLQKFGLSLPSSEDAVEGGDRDAAEGNPIESMPQLLTLMGSIGITPKQVMDYAPKVADFLQKNANVDAASILKA